jgi:predicted phage gp36 major capsid-like protein
VLLEEEEEEEEEEEQHSANNDDVDVIARVGVNEDSDFISGQLSVADASSDGPESDAEEDLFAQSQQSRAWEENYFD